MTEETKVTTRFDLDEDSEHMRGIMLIKDHLIGEAVQSQDEHGPEGLNIWINGILRAYIELALACGVGQEEVRDLVTNMHSELSLQHVIN